MSAAMASCRNSQRTQIFGRLHYSGRIFAALATFAHFVSSFLIRAGRLLKARIGRATFLSPSLLFRMICGHHGHGHISIEISKQSLEILNLGQIIVDDVWIGWMSRCVVLVIVLGMIERRKLVELCHYRMFESAGLVELSDVCFGNSFLCGVLIEKC